MFATGRSWADVALFSLMLVGLAATIGGSWSLGGKFVVRHGWWCDGINR